uniref:Copine domain-containing protein n=1 Tax=Panagrellus redivivus TaxID=6233 RepID=A0A7E4WAG3_PANRE
MFKMAPDPEPEAPSRLRRSQLWFEGVGGLNPCPEIGIPIVHFSVNNLKTFKMNMARIRHILEMRRANKAPPLLPPRVKRGSDADVKRLGPKEIVDIHVKIRKFRVTKSKSNAIMCIFSESEDNTSGPWRMSTASEVLQKEIDIDLPSVFAIEFQFERTQLIKLDICDWTNNDAATLGYTVFAVSELVVHEKEFISRQIINDETGDVIADVQISCTIREKPHSVLLQFVAKNLGKKNMIYNSAQIFFEVQKKDTTVVYRSEVARFSQKITFRMFSLQSTDMSQESVEFMVYFRDSKTQKGVMGSFETNYAMLKNTQPEANVYQVNYDNSRGVQKSCGTFELLRCNDVAVSSFLDYISTGATLNFCVAIDFSRPDQFVDEAFIRQYLSDVELAVRSTGEAFRDFSANSSYGAFGFGAKIPPLFRESQEFCLSLETDPYVRGLDGIMSAFKNSFTKVQPITIAHLSHVIYYVSKLAQNALNRSQTTQPAYYVLALITRGVFDDLKETIQAIIYASRAPISIVFVGIGGGDLNELERLGTSRGRLNYHGRKPERDCVQYVNLTRCREEEPNLKELKNLIAERGLVGIPHQMASWMTKNGYKPHSPPVVFSQEVECDQAYQATPMECGYRQPNVGMQAGCVFSTQTTTATHTASFAVPLRQLPTEPKRVFHAGTVDHPSGLDRRLSRQATTEHMAQLTSRMSIDHGGAHRASEAQFYGYAQPYAVQCVRSEAVPVMHHAQHYA